MRSSRRINGLLIALTCATFLTTPWIAAQAADGQKDLRASRPGQEAKIGLDLQAGDSGFDPDAKTWRTHQEQRLFWGPSTVHHVIRDNAPAPWVADRWGR